MDTNRKPVAFVAERSINGHIWCITPVYGDDWYSDMSGLVYRQCRIFVMSVTCNIHCGGVTAHVEEGHQHVNSILVVDGEPQMSISKFTRIAFSTEELARAWVSANGQPKVECPVCHEQHSVRLPKCINNGWLDIEKYIPDNVFLISEHLIEGVRCDGSTTAIHVRDIPTPQ